MSVEDRTQRVINEFSARAKKAAVVAGQIAVKTAAEYAAKDSGTMSKEIYASEPVEDGEKGWIVRIISPVSYSAYQEIGPAATGKRGWKFRPFIRPAMSHIKSVLQGIVDKQIGVR